jgi:hypothetical protein
LHSKKDARKVRAHRSTNAMHPFHITTTARQMNPAIHQQNKPMSRDRRERGLCLAGHGAARLDIGFTAD